MSRYPGFEGRAVTDMLLKQGRENKYHAKRVQVDGYYFDSKAEAKRYSELKLMQKAGLIDALKLHPVYGIPSSKFDSFITHICYVELDFFYRDLKSGKVVYEDVKGLDNPLSKLKRKLVEAFYGITVTVIK